MNHSKRPIFILVLSVVSALVGCSTTTEIGTDISLESITEEMTQNVAAEKLISLGNGNADYIEMMYGIPKEDYTEIAIRIIPGGTFSEEIFLAKAVSDDAKNRIAENLNWHLESVIDQAKDYDPRGYSISQKCSVKTDGLYVWLIISDPSNEMDKTLTRHMIRYSADDVPVYGQEAEEVSDSENVKTNDQTTMENVEINTVVASENEQETKSTDEKQETSLDEPGSESALPISKKEYGATTESEKVPDEWWDDALFLGNSVGRNIENYVMKQRLGEWSSCMGKSVWWTTYKYDISSCAKNAGMGARYEGGITPLSKIIENNNSKKVFIILSHVGIIFRGISFEDSVKYTGDVCDIIKNIDPEIKIYICSVSPRLSLSNSRGVNNEALRRYNVMLLDMVNERKDCYYIDLFEPLANDDGCLKKEYCMEKNAGSIHLNDAGSAAVIEYLYTHTS